MEKLTFEQLPEAVEKLASELQTIKELIQQIPRESPIESEEVLTVEQAASFLSLSVTTIYTMVSKRKIPNMKREKRCYFLKEDLIEYLKTGRKKTLAELDSDSLKFQNK